jgi:hypothetical protein
VGVVPRSLGGGVVSTLLAVGAAVGTLHDVKLQRRQRERAMILSTMRPKRTHSHDGKHQ